MDRAEVGLGTSRPQLPPLVVIKTRVPVHRTGLVRRTELIELLADSRDRQITLIHAPAGYGKSTLLMQWAEADPLRRFAWLTLEDTENDPILLWRYVLYALRALTPGFAEEAWRLIQKPQPDLQPVISLTLNSLLGVPGRAVLVLDDFHVIANPECHASIQYFLDHLPGSTQLALGTRFRPPLAFSDPQSRGLVLEVDSAALRFTEEETLKTLQGVSSLPGPEVAALIHQGTEGWPAGVYLAAHDATGLEELGRPGSIAAVRTYLEEQILDPLPEADREVLAEWSILRHLNASLCNRVSGRRDSASRLDRLARDNLLITPLDVTGDWYRTHDLLREALKREVAKRPAEEQRVLHLRAMEWWLEKDEAARAIDHALEAGSYERAGELITAGWLEFMLSGLLATLRNWIGRFPQEPLLAYPPILVSAAWVFAFSGQTAATHRFADAARKAAFAHPMPDGSSSYESAVAMLLAGLGHHGMEAANEHAERALRLEPRDSSWRPLAAALAGVTRCGLGRQDDARVAFAEAIRDPTVPDGVATYGRGQLALLAMSEGKWEEARNHADLAAAQIEEAGLGNLLSSGAGLVAAAATAAHFGNRGLALQRLRSLAPIQRVLSDAIPFDAFQINLIVAETYLALGDRGAAGVHADEAASRLAAFGDSGIYKQRLADVESGLASEGKSVETGKNEPESLTDRELQILALLPTDLSLREIGSELYVSRNTAKTHVSNLYRKLGVTNRTAAVARARKLGLI